MNILLILLPVSLVLLGVAIGTFFWAVNRGQFDDLDTPALRILEDDPLPPETQSSPDADTAGHERTRIRADGPGRDESRRHQSR